MDYAGRAEIDLGPFRIFGWQLPKLLSIPLHASGRTLPLTFSSAVSGKASLHSIVKVFRSSDTRAVPAGTGRAARRARRQQAAGAST